MRIISFAWTTPALLAREKTVTRRDWKSSYAKTFHKGDLLQAWDRSPRFGGKKVGVIRLTHTPYRERLCDIPQGDWWNEGFAYLEKRGIKIDGSCPRTLWAMWHKSIDYRWVLRFEIVSLVKEPLRSGRG